MNTTLTITFRLRTGSFKNTTEIIPGFRHVDSALKEGFLNWPSLSENFQVYLTTLKHGSKKSTILSVLDDQTPIWKLLCAIQTLVSGQKDGGDGFLPTNQSVEFSISDQETFLLFYHEDDEGKGWELVKKS